MEVECMLWFLGLVAFVSGYTPTFRNEATHPLKAPTESTLGLQMGDESIGRTKSNPPKTEPYFTGGKHFEYLLLNDSSVLLTSLQNDNFLDAVSAAQQTASSDKDGYSTKSNFLNHDGAKATSTAKPSRQANANANAHAHAHAHANAIASRLRSAGTGKIASKASELPSSKDSVSAAAAAAAANRDKDAAFRYGAANTASKGDDFASITSFGFDKGPDISSTTKLYSKQANKSDENFASFTSPLAAKPMANIFSDRDELVLAAAAEPPAPSEPRLALQTLQANASSAHKQSYDYDDSFTRLLISNGILKPENNASSERTTERAAPFRSVFHAQTADDANPSAEDISRIMDGSIVGLIRNGTEARNSVSSVARSVPGSALKPATMKYPTPDVSPSTLPQSDTSTQQPLGSISVSKIKKPKPANSISTTTHSSNGNLSFIDAHPTANVSATQTKLRGDRALDSGNVEATSSAVPQLEEQTSTTTPTTTTLDSSDAVTTTAVTIDTGLSTASTSTELHSESNWLKFENHPLNRYETTAPAKTISSSADLAHTDQSNENPLSAKGYTDDSSTIESKTENLPPSNRLLFQPAAVKDNNDDGRPLPAAADVVDRRRLPALNQLIMVPLIREQPTQKLPTGSSLTSTTSPERHRSRVRPERVISVSEFKSLIEDCVRHLFYFVARFIREQNLLSTRALLDSSSSSSSSSSSNQHRVTLKRFGFVNVADAFNRSARDFDRYDFSRWRNVADGSDTKVDVHLNQLFDDYDTEDARWIVFASADDGAFWRLRDGGDGGDGVVVSAIDSTLAARVSLEYCGLKINAVVAMPSQVATNVTLPERDESSIDVNEELPIEEPGQPAANASLRMGAARYRVLQLFSRYSQMWTNARASQMRRVDYAYRHEDVEFYIFVLGGAVCVFSVLSPLLYVFYKIIHYQRTHSSSGLSSSSSSGMSSSSATSSSLAGSFIRLPAIFRRHKFHYRHGHEKMPESRCESLNVIFSEEFDRKYSSWFDNTHHSSSILKASAGDGEGAGAGAGAGAGGAAAFNDDVLDDYPEFSDLTRNVCENNSPRLSRENRLNMGCRPACMLLPHPATYLIRGEKDERYFDNPNYSR